MIERLHRRRPVERTARREARRPRGPGAGPGSTVPVTLPPGAPAESEPSILGFPAEIEPDDDPDDVGPDGTGVAAQGGRYTAVRTVVLRRADLVAGSTLALAGVTANVSLWLPWVAGEDRTGLAIVRQAVDAVGSGSGEPLQRGLWQPVVIVLCGGLLAVLGLLVIRPAHTHRLVGVSALFVALAATAAVMALLVDADWSSERFASGFWSGATVAVFGLLGAFKAMLTLPRVAIVEQVRQLGG
jgi:hypothetical protein